jgi:hypothetical protein
MPLIERLTRTVDGGMRSAIRLRKLGAPGDLRLCGDRSRHIVLDWKAQHGAVRP